ncbi:hypothetical protein GFD22_07310 [Bifidobacterium avesanii]|uniref:Uncharacterized protein n=2 Tax=Bifidobacterium avesanii TaxID=1798157 RepID=A0A7K3TI49_9BIFI|nr:hypothetical protein [Bifidobacterium avesanii]
MSSDAPSGCCRTHVSVTRTTSVSGDGVTRTEIRMTEVRGSVARDADANAAAADCGCDCFDVESSCDKGEKAMIAALRAYLRPDQAPECLMDKLSAVLDRCCRE